MLIWIATALALTCDTPTGSITLTTPDEVPPNAELVVTYTGQPPQLDLRDPDDQPVQGLQRIEAGHVVWSPDRDLSPGPHTLRADDQRFVVQVNGPVDTSPPLPPLVESAVREVTDADEWGDPRDQTTLRFHSVPAGSHVELEFTPDNGGEPLLAATDERVVTLGYRACESNWPSGYSLKRTYTLRIRSVDAAGHPSSWMPVLVRTVDLDASDQTGCQVASVPAPWGWLPRRKRPHPPE